MTRIGRRDASLGSVLLGLLLTSCHGSMPTGSTAIPSTTEASTTAPLAAGAAITFVSAETGGPVAGADVTVGAARYRTDESGAVRLSATTALPVTIQTSASGYLLRETVLHGGDDQRLSLWPSRSPTGLDEDLTLRVVYTDAAGGASGALRLHRLEPGRVSIVPSPEILADAAALLAQQQAAAALTSATGGAVVFEVTSQATSAVVVTTMINPQDPAMGGHAALTYRYTEGSRITNARTVFASLDVARMASVVTHELGHAFGLEHSTDPRDLMYPVVSLPKQLNRREVLAIELMLKRRPGNRFPDDDRDHAAPLARTVSVVACGD